MADPWLKFYTTDWRADPRLRMCSLSARGLWIELICLMHESDPYGHLLVNGRAPTPQQIAGLVGASVDDVESAIEELQGAGVFSRTKGRVIYSRKMVKGENRARKSRENGKKGGNPKLCNKTKKSNQDNLGDKGRHKTQNPEARIQKYSVPNGTDADGVESAEAVPFDPGKILFDAGTDLLTSRGVSISHARSMIGRWCKDFPKPVVLSAVKACREAGAIDPIGWINNHLATQRAGGANARSRAQSEFLKQWADGSTEEA